MGRSSPRKGAFTLIELLVVISIIALLVTILIPAVSTATRYARNLRTKARVAALAGGCDAYHSDHECYPGQAYPHKLLGSTVDPTDPKQFTGSQWLAKALFTDPDLTPPDDYPNPEYASLKAADDLIDPVQLDVYKTIWDRNHTKRASMAILYYPARLGISGLGQYWMDDNRKNHPNYKNEVGGAYVDIEWKSKEDEDGHATQDAFEKYIKDRGIDGDLSTTPHAPGAFLIIAAGSDRLFGTSDDIRYPTFKSD